jgi:hypothetical protein
MFYTNMHDQFIGQVGTSQAGDINRSISCHLHQKAVLTNCRVTNLPTRSEVAHKDNENWLDNLAARLVGKMERPYSDVVPAAH